MGYRLRQTALRYARLRRARKFVAGDPHAIVIGTPAQAEYLKQAGQPEPFIVARRLDEQDWTPFEPRYAATGGTLLPTPDDGTDSQEPWARHTGPMACGPEEMFAVRRHDKSL
jgi:hypothetical protein